MPCNHVDNYVIICVITILFTMASELILQLTTSALIEAYHNEPILWVSNKCIRRGQGIGMGTAKLRPKGPKPDARITESGGWGSCKGL